MCSRKEMRERENRRILKKAEESIDSWPEWKKKFAEEDSEFLSSYRCQMHAPVSNEKKETKMTDEKDDELDLNDFLNYWWNGQLGPLGSPASNRFIMGLVNEICEVAEIKNTELTSLLSCVLTVLEHGGDKRSGNNWRTKCSSEHLSACVRHARGSAAGDCVRDSDSGELHSVHVLTRALMAALLEIIECDNSL